MLGVFLFVGVPSQSRLAPCQLPQRGSQVGAQPEICRKPSLASPFGGGGLALARTERASCQRPPPMGCVEALAGGPLSRLTATAPPRGEPSMCATKSLRKAKSRLPLWGRWTRVSEDGEGKLPAASSHGLCGSAGGLPSQSPSGDSSPKGGAKSRLPLWARKKVLPAPEAKKDTRRHRMSCFFIERAAVLDPHVPRADALLGVGQGQPEEAQKSFARPQTQKRHPAAPDVLLLIESARRS